MLGRRFLILVAVLMGLTALAASVAPREDLIRDRNRRDAGPTPTPTPTPGAATVRTIQRTISTRDAPVRVAVRQGQLLELTITGPQLDSVELLDEIEPLEAHSPARFQLLAEERGQYPIALVDSGRRIGTLVVR
jgi:hypothetical protein